MYTFSVEKEIDFISSLWGSHDTKMADGQIVDVYLIVIFIRVSKRGDIQGK